jgi:WD40 repeat protein
VALWPALPPVPRLTFPDDGLRGFAFTPDSRSFVFSNDTRVQVWDLASGRLEREWPRPTGPADAAWDLVVAPAGRRALVYDRDRYAPLLLDLDDGRQTPLPPSSRDLPISYAFRALVAFAADGQAVAWCAWRAGDGRPVVRVWRADAPVVEVPLDHPGMWIAFAPDGRTVAVCAGDNKAPAVVHLFDAASGRSLTAFTTNDPIPARLKFSPDGTILAAVTLAGPTFIRMAPWDVADRQQLAFTNQRLVGWDADGRAVVESLNLNGLDHLDPRTGAVTRWIVPPTPDDVGSVPSPAFSADRRRMVVPAQMSLRPA